MYTFQGVQPQLHGDRGSGKRYIGCEYIVTINQKNIMEVIHTWLVLQV